MTLSLRGLANLWKERGHARLLRKMQRDWDERARQNAKYFIATGRTDWSDEEFYASGDQTIAQDILTDLHNVCQGKTPNAMRVLEIGCGAGRLTRALARQFGEVHAVDVSGEMIARARQALAGYANTHVYQNNGCDLAVLPQLEFDFAYSNIVFQHIPSHAVIETYVREVHRLLRPGALFKFQVQGAAGRRRRDDTWHGASFSEAQARSMAQRCGFDFRYSTGAGTQYFWLWFFKNSTGNL
ncbi:MAG: methyltransferase domain-containing protein [Bryobacterales bacterium]|nr:methyltransferase domain-containing protein [Bryobacterales bacterium]